MTRIPVPDHRPVTLTIAGSDSGGGAGIQADLKTMEALGVFGTSVVTAVTAQNTMGVTSSFTLPLDEIEAQLAAIQSDFDLRAVKTGMLATADTIELVAAHVVDIDVPVIVDPVMVAASGDRLLEPAGEDAYETLIAEATLVTPNADEAEVLTGRRITDVDAATVAGEAILDFGTQAVLVKGGHVGGDVVNDVLVTSETTRTFSHPRIETNATHGAGCTLSSAIAAYLAREYSIVSAVASGIECMERAVRYPLAVGQGPGSVHHLVGLRERATRHETAEAVEAIVSTFVEMDVSPLVPEVGMNVVGATPYAEAIDETAAIEGRLTRVMNGVKPNRGVRFGASSHVARFLLTAREYDPSLQFAVNCRFNEAIESALVDLEWPIAEYDRETEPPAVKAEEGETMQWAAQQVFADRDDTPVAVIDRGAVGKEAITKFLASTATEVTTRMESLLNHIR